MPSTVRAYQFSLGKRVARMIGILLPVLLVGFGLPAVATAQPVAGHRAAAHPAARTTTTPRKATQKKGVTGKRATATSPGTLQPLSVSLDTMTSAPSDCAGQLGISIAVNPYASDADGGYGPATRCYPITSTGLTLLTVHRSDLISVAYDPGLNLSNNINQPGDLSAAWNNAIAADPNNDLFVLVNPAATTVGCSSGIDSPDCDLLFNLHLLPYEITGTETVPAFSVVATPTASCSTAGGFGRCNADANPGHTLIPPPGLPGAESPGEIRGYLQLDTSNDFNFTYGQFLQYSTGSITGGLTNTITVNGAPYPSATLTSGQSGFQLVVLNGATLSPELVGDKTYVSNGVSAPQMNALSTDLGNAAGTPGLLLLLQSIGTPHVSPQNYPGWTNVDSVLKQLGGTVSKFSSLNAPEIQETNGTVVGVPGYDVPNGYAFVTVTGTYTSDKGAGSDPYTVEQTSAPPGSNVIASGMLYPDTESDWAPYATSPSGLNDATIFQTTYQARYVSTTCGGSSQPWPQVSPDCNDAQIIQDIQSALHQEDGFPVTLGLRDEYWADFLSGDWPQYSADLAAMPNPDPNASQIAFDAVRAQLVQEFRDVETVQAELGSSTSPLIEALKGVSSEIGTQLPADAAAFQAATVNLAPEPPPPDGVDPMAIISAVLGIAGGAFGFGGVADVLSKVATVASNLAVVASSAVALAGSLTSSGGGESGPESYGVSIFNQAITAGSADVAQELVNQFDAAVANITEIAEINVTDWGKLSALSGDLANNPSYDVNDQQALNGAEQTIETSAEQEAWDAMLPDVYGILASTALAGTNHSASTGFPLSYVSDSLCQAVNSLGPDMQQAFTTGFVLNTDGTVAPEGQVDLMLSDGNANVSTAYPNQSLVDALFYPAGGPPVTVNGATVAPAGLDPAQVFEHVLPAVTAGGDSCGGSGPFGYATAPHPLQSTDAPGSMLQVVSGANQERVSGGGFPTMEVRWADSAGNPPVPTADYPVDFSSDGLSPSSVTFDADSAGVATADAPTFRVSSQGGPFVVQASGGGATTTWNELAIPQGMALDPVSPTGTQTAVIGQPLPSNLTVQVQNPGGTVWPVEFTTPSPGSVASPAPSALFSGTNQVLTLDSASGGQATTPQALQADLTLGSYDITAYLPILCPGGPGTNPCPASAQVQFPVSNVIGTTTLALTASPGTTEFAGTAVTFTAGFTSQLASGPGGPIQPSGTVQFQANDQNIGTPVAIDANLKAVSIPIQWLKPGVDLITAVYSGDSTYGPTPTPATLTELIAGRFSAQSTLTSPACSGSSCTAQTGQTVTVTASVESTIAGTPDPTGSVQFQLGGQPIPGCAAVAVGPVGGSIQATCSTSFTVAQSGEQIRAEYLGDQNYQPNYSNTFTVTANQGDASITITSSANPAVVGQPVTFTAIVAAAAPAGGTPTGPVLFFDQNAEVSCETLLVTVGGQAQATCTTTFASPQVEGVYALYDGDTDFVGGETATLSQTVNEAPTAVSLTSGPNPAEYGSTVTMTATVSVPAPGAGSPSGTVDFYDGQDLIGGATVSNGTAVLTTSTLQGRTVGLFAVYQGDGTFLPSVSIVDNQTITAAATKLVANPVAAGTFYLSATLTRADTGTPIGARTVFFYAGTTLVCSSRTDPHGIAACSGVSQSSAILAHHGYTARFFAHTDYGPSSGKGPLT